MVGFPQSTILNRRIPKQKFYDNLVIPAELKRVFVEQIGTICWKNKIAPSTVNVTAGSAVTEVEVLKIRLNQRDFDERVLRLIDRQLPYHILFLLEYKGDLQAWIGYKEASQVKTAAFKPGTYYHTEWLSPDELTLRLNGLDMDAVYEGFVRQVAGSRLDADPNRNLGEAVARDERRQKLQREITALEAKVNREKQFNVRVTLNGELKRMKRELEGLCSGEDAL